jgi:hypothetical protein
VVWILSSFQIETFADLCEDQQLGQLYELMQAIQKKEQEDTESDS